MKFMESHFWYNKRQKNGILFLILILILMQLFLYFGDFSTSKETEFDLETFSMFQKELDSLSRNQKTDSWKPYPFNPNYLTDFKAYKLGLSIEEIDRLAAFRKKGKYINSAADFQLVTGINDSLSNLISPLLKFPVWTQKNKPVAESTSIEKRNYNQVSSASNDLNLVTVSDLLSVKGVSEKLAKRIISYRTKLQGYSFNDQLFEVYYLNRKIGESILLKYSVLQKPKIEKLNINTASFKDLLKLPYIDYELTKKICGYRDEFVHFNRLEELKEIDAFPLEKFDRIILYLSAD